VLQKGNDEKEFWDSHPSSMRTFKYYTPLFLQKIAYVLFFVVYKVFVKIEIKGKENIVGLKGPIIIAANHTHELDVTAILLILPFISPLYPLYFVTNPTEKFKTFGWRSYIYGENFFNLLGGYAVYSGHHSYSVALEDHIKLLLEGHTVCIFPEGKRTRDGNLNPAHGGLGYMVYKTKATVIPVAINTFFNISLWDFLTRRRTVTLTVGKPMSAADLITALLPEVSDLRHMSQTVLDEIQELIED